MLGEEFVGKVATVDFIVEVFCAVGVCGSALWTDDDCSDGTLLHVGIIERVEVDSFAIAMIRQHL